MLCTRCFTRVIRAAQLKISSPILSATKSFTSLTPLRPSLGVFATPAITAAIAPRISLHPALRALQVRNGPRNTFDPSHRVRKRRAGFLARKRTRGGRAVLKRRMLKGRKSLSH
ncbi:hypothetical protein Q9L58_008173 [Maublancomyces gigas]|uniref:50S ribosomal protein L34, chloroplastic n=1 Tax=Discina gigas TaxID=1032678 RepID=A0ABR3GAF7_9PEZI